MGHFFFNGATEVQVEHVFPNWTSCLVQGGQTAGQHLQADGDVNQGDKDTIPLDRAVQEQHEQHKQHADVFSQLLDTQADGNPPDVNRAVPLFTTFQSLGQTGSRAVSKRTVVPCLPKRHVVSDV